jgi:thiol-disulfide isomerase/thioredoxin
MRVGFFNFFDLLLSISTIEPSGTSFEMCPKWKWISVLGLLCLAVEYSSAYNPTTSLIQYDLKLRRNLHTCLTRPRVVSNQCKLSGPRQLTCQVAGGAASPSIRLVKSETELDGLLHNGLVLLQLSATKCRKCVALAAKYKSLADQYASQQHVIFAKLVVDGESKELAQARFKDVKITPTFLLFQNGAKVDETVSTAICVHIIFRDTYPESCNAQVGLAEASEIMSEVKGMLAPFVGDSLAPQEPSNDSSQTPAPEPAQAQAEAPPAPAPAEEEGGGMSQGDCAGPEGCEIVWD